MYHHPLHLRHFLLLNGEHTAAQAQEEPLYMPPRPAGTILSIIAPALAAVAQRWVYQTLTVSTRYSLI